jgi:hypothetical protein
MLAQQGQFVHNLQINNRFHNQTGTECKVFQPIDFQKLKFLSKDNLKGSPIPNKHREQHKRPNRYIGYTGNYRN